MESINEKVFELFDSGLTAGKIAQKLKIKKAVVNDILGELSKEGLGTKIENFTEVTGIKAVVESITDDCGCKARAKALNKLFPNRKLNDLSNEDFDYLTEFFSTKKTSVNRDVQSELVKIYNGVFNSKRQVSNCSTCVVKIIEELRKVYDAANN